MNKAIYITIFILVFSFLTHGCGSEAGDVPEPYNILMLNEPPTEDVPKTRVVVIKLAMESGPIKEVAKPPAILMGPRGLSHYPLAAARDKIEGHVVVSFVVDTDGKGKEPEVLEADPEGVFEESALTIIEQHYFSTGELVGELVHPTVPCTVIMTVEYTLQGRLKRWINRLLGPPRLKNLADK